MMTDLSLAPLGGLHLRDPTLLQTGAFIAGEWRREAPHGRFSVVDPATLATIAEVRLCGATEARAAIAAASEAFPHWRRQPSRLRSRILKCWLDQIERNAEDLAQLITWESGKPLAEARAEVHYAASYVEWFAEQGPRANGDVVPPPSSDRMVIVTREPVGVVACVTPWNFPIAMLARKVAPALSVGCTVVAKPSEETPLTALALAELSRRAELPAGVLNVVTGRAPDIGDEFLASADVRKITFTGSTLVGKMIAEKAARTVKRTSMELGGNAPCIVFNDANLDQAADGVMAAKFRNAGQTCVSVNRLLVHRDIVKMFTDKLRQRMAQLCVGPGATPTTTIGPVIHQKAAARIELLLTQAQAEGAKVERFGSGRDLGPAFVLPALVTDAKPNLRLCVEESFGPVLPVLVFDDEVEAIALANKTPSGLAAYVYTEDHRRLLRVAGQLNVGMIGLNEAAISNEATPFGGVKESGYGREGSVHGLDDYLEHKYLCLGGLAP